MEGLTWKTKTKVTYHFVIKVGMVRFAIMLLDECVSTQEAVRDILGRERNIGMKGCPPLSLVGILSVPFRPNLQSKSSNKRKEEEPSRIHLP